MPDCQVLYLRGLRRLAQMALAVAVGVAPALALEAPFPEGTEQTAMRVERVGSYGLPIGPWADGSMLTRLTEGRIEQTAWRIPAPNQSTLELLQPMRAALLADGWRMMFECETVECGGFDFRYSTQVLPEPGMHVDLGDFRFLSARKGMGMTEEHISLLVSRSTGAGAGYVQMIHVGPPDALPNTPRTDTAPARPEILALSTRSADGIGVALERGSVVLDGLEFASGAADTPKGADNLLKDLAAYLADHPDRTVALVGHTDAAGSLEANVALSKRRAEAVRNRLVQEYGVEAGRLVALGAGFMSPRDSNLTEEGRARNRRVEAILASTR